MTCDSMNIYVSRVPPEGLQDHARYAPSAMDMDRTDIHLRDPFDVDASIMLADRELVVNVQIQCPARMTCARCLEEFSRTLTPTALFSYPAQASDVVDITDDVRQEILLAYPMIPVCRPDCKGLCSTCGQNLNQGPCPHHPGAR